MRTISTIVAILTLAFESGLTYCHGQVIGLTNQNLIKFGSKDQAHTDWAPWSERDEIRPKCYIDDRHVRTTPISLAISGDLNPAEHGGWNYIVKDIRPGQFYRFSAYYQTKSVPDETRQVVARLDWLDSQGRRAGQPDYGYETTVEGTWTHLTMNVPAPEQASAVKIELSLGWAPSGTVWWTDLQFGESTPPQPKWVRLGTISLHPKNNPDNLGAFLDAIDEIAKDKPDIICLGEEILTQGTSKSYASIAEPIPGPSTKRIGVKARQYHMYIIAGLTERDGAAIYNTAVLIDRCGHLAGKYRKVFLPREEVEGGLTPGNSFPIFETDFGKIGIMICWDAEYVDAARALAIQGAEIIFAPAAGGYLTLLKARALENHVYLVSSGYGFESAIIDPTGTVLFATLISGINKTIAINLADRLADPWLGDMRARFHKEARSDLPAYTSRSR